MALTGTLIGSFKKFILQEKIIMDTAQKVFSERNDTVDLFVWYDDRDFPLRLKRQIKLRNMLNSFLLEQMT
ncbi:hypothetical protein ML462_14460 [Gramella lutea]|uniref:Uncharacterized protein n=1 Tax=Christiangramia lutea TaxID=1607951 RepID=A0A9X1V4K0_9FLAO|nr:hypothetical protein [Christiangramia lutea]MCH4824372.1 hypothetical protein [Christiangramia lutea]